MTDPIGRTDASLVTRFSRLDPGELPRAYAELLHGFERAPGAEEVTQLVQAITQLLSALQTGRVVTPAQALAMSAELSTAMDAAWRRLMEQGQ